MLPEAAVSALLIPNHAINMVANERNMRFPIASKRPAWSVMSCVRNANKSAKVLVVIIAPRLWHAPGTHGGAGVGDLCVQERFPFGSKADVIVDSSGFRVALAFGVN